MAITVNEVVEAAKNWTSAQRREALARLWPEQSLGEDDSWITVRFGDAMRVTAYAPEQDEYVSALRETLRRGALARVENRSDGNYEIYGTDRTYYVTMTPKREFAALLDSWPIDVPPLELLLPEPVHECHTRE